MVSKTVTRSIQLFLGVAEFKCFLLVCDVVWLLFSIFSFFCIVIWWLHPSATPRNYHGSFIGLYFDQSEGRTGKNMVLKLPLSLEDLFCQANKIFYSFRAQIPNYRILLNLIQVFTGNTDRDTVVNHQLTPMIKARYIRLIPVEWNNHISLRMELYTC